MILLIKLFSLICLYTIALSFPSIGQVDRNYLETYEELSEESNDFPLFDNLTFHFTCEDKKVGLYADIDYNCKIFHVCDNEGQGFPVICPNDTFFDQQRRICTDDGVNCEHANQWYYLNELPSSYEITEIQNLLLNEEDDVPSVVPLMPS